MKSIDGKKTFTVKNTNAYLQLRLQPRSWFEGTYLAGYLGTCRQCHGKKWDPASDLRLIRINERPLL